MQRFYALFVTAGTSGQIIERGGIGQCAIQLVPISIREFRIVLVGNVCAMCHCLQTKVHQFPAIGQVMKNIGDINMALMAEIREFAGKEQSDDIGELPLHLDRLNGSFWLATLGELN